MTYIREGIDKILKKLIIRMFDIKLIHNNVINYERVKNEHKRM